MEQRKSLTLVPNKGPTCSARSFDADKRPCFDVFAFACLMAVRIHHYCHVFLFPVNMSKEGEMIYSAIVLGACLVIVFLCWTERCNLTRRRNERGWKERRKEQSREIPPLVVANFAIPDQDTPGIPPSSQKAKLEGIEVIYARPGASRFWRNLEKKDTNLSPGEFRFLFGASWEFFDEERKKEERRRIKERRKKEKAEEKTEEEVSEDVGDLDSINEAFDSEDEEEGPIQLRPISAEQLQSADDDASRQIEVRESRDPGDAKMEDKGESSPELLEDDLSAPEFVEHPSDTKSRENEREESQHDDTQSEAAGEAQLGDQVKSSQPGNEGQSLVKPAESNTGNARRALATLDTSSGEIEASLSCDHTVKSGDPREHSALMFSESEEKATKSRENETVTSREQTPPSRDDSSGSDDGDFVMV